MFSDLLSSLLWSLGGFVVGVPAGFALGKVYASRKKDVLMTTPERLRARQIRNDWFIAIVALGLVVATVFFLGQQGAQQKCISTFITVNAKTGAIRSDLVERESRATRRVIKKALTAETRGDIVRARARYATALEEIDTAREENPVQPFPKGVCD